MGGVWTVPMFIGLFVCLILFFRKRCDQLPPEMTALWAYVVAGALFTVWYPKYVYGDLHTAFQATAGQVLAGALILPLVVLELSSYQRRWLLWAFNFVVALDIVLIWWPDKRALLGNRSFDAAFIAATLPFLTNPIRVAVLATVASFHSTTALAIVAAQALAVALQQPLWRWPVLSGVSAFIALAGVLQTNSYGEHVSLLAGASRFVKWQTYYDWWKQDIDAILFGSGPGSFMWVSIMLDKMAPPLYSHALSDWVQITLELGLVGLGLALVGYLRGLWRARLDTLLLPALAGIGAFGLTYHPLRHFLPALLVLLVLTEAYASRTQDRHGTSVRSRTGARRGGTRL